jgi:Tfp pilus assembly PilM family ATPase
VYGSTTARTGIEFGTSSVKLVRGEGRQRLERVTHAGLEPWDGQNREDRVPRAAEALRTLLRDLGLSRGRLGRIAVSVSWQESTLREAELPPLTAQEFAQALPYEARNHLDLEAMETPVLAGQILGGPRAAAAGAGTATRVLLAAAPKPRRDYVVSVLECAGLEPQVVDLEPLAGLNALFAELGDSLDPEAAVALLDIGARHTALHVASRGGGLLTRNVAPGAPADGASPSETGYLMKLSAGVEQTLTFYRGRYHREVGAIHAAGGGAHVAARLEALQTAVKCPVILFYPVAGLGAGGRIAGAVLGPEYLTACGLCRWGDVDDV